MIRQVLHATHNMVNVVSLLGRHLAGYKDDLLDMPCKAYTLNGKEPAWLINAWIPSA